jgi:hypothetical protein
LVSRYLTNKLIPRKPLPRRNLTICSLDRSREIIRYYPKFPLAIPVLGVRHLRLTTPFAAVPAPEGTVLARLACLIHAANVHSEPGSNPSNCSLIQPARLERQTSRQLTWLEKASANPQLTLARAPQRHLPLTWCLRRTSFPEPRALERLSPHQLAAPEALTVGDGAIFDGPLEINQIVKDQLGTSRAPCVRYLVTF